MSKGKRKEDRKYKRLDVRYGSEEPHHRCVAVQLSTRGAFLQAARPMYKAGSRIVVEIASPDKTYVINAVVRHIRNIPPQMAGSIRPGMGVEFLSPPPELQDFLDSL